MTILRLNLLNVFIVLCFVLQFCIQICVCKAQWNLFGKPGNGYYLAVKIGNPPQKFNLLIDTGSGNLAIAGAPHEELKSYYELQNSTTFEMLDQSVKVIYTQGWWEGYLGKDFVKLSNFDYIEPILTDLSIITNTHRFYVNNSNWQGILGLAYSEIAKPIDFVTSWFDSLSESFPNVTNHRFDLELCGPQPFPLHDTHYGKLSIGNSHAACGISFLTTPIRRRWYYEIQMSGLAVGAARLEVPCAHFNWPKTIIDSGTSNLQLSNKTYDIVISEIRRQTEIHSDFFNDGFWNRSEPACFSRFDKKIWSSLPILSLFLEHNETTEFGVQLPPESYLRPVVTRSDKACWMMGVERGATVGTVLGTVLLEGLCLTFDRGRGVIAFSASGCGPKVYFSSLTARTDGTSCLYSPPVVSGIFVAFLAILLGVSIPLTLAGLRFIWLSWIKHRLRRGQVPFISLIESNA